MLLSLLMTISALVAPPPTRLACPTDACRDCGTHLTCHERVALAAFDRSVAAYVELHRRLARATPPLQLTADPVQLRCAIDSLAEAIRLARPGARAGDVFTAPVAGAFRRRIHGALQRLDVAALVAEMEEDADPNAPAPVANAPFPWTSGNAMWPSVLAALPPLPEELEYRFVGADLVLVDIPASLVVDLLDDALALER